MNNVYKPGAEPVPGYKLIQSLGRGAFGEAWEAEAPGEVRVALKIISNLNGIHALREWQSLQAVKNLKHSNLVSIFGVWLKDEDGNVLTTQQIEDLIPPEVNPQSPPAPQSGERTGTLKAPPKPARASVRVHSAATMRSDDDEGTGTAPTTEKKSGGSQGASGSSGSDGGSAGGSSGESASGSQAKWKNFQGKVPPLELMVAMTLGEGTLMDELKASGNKGVPRDRLLRYMEDAAKGLEYLNKQQIQHCDVKPENLLLVGGGVQVCDYGSALKSIYAAEARTHQGYTEQYAAPEQLAGRKIKLHRQTDLYALAITYYALRTGKYPWADLSSEPITVIKYHERFDFSALAGLTKHPFEIEAIRKALHRDHAKRYKTVTEFVESLETAVENEREAERTRRQRMVRRVLGVVAALMLIALGVGAYLNWDAIKNFGKSKTAIARLEEGFDRKTTESFAQGVQAANDDGELKGDADATAKAIVRGWDKTAATPENYDELLGYALTIDPVYREHLSASLVEWYRASPKFSAAIRDKRYADAYVMVIGDGRLTDWPAAELADPVLAKWIEQAAAETTDAEVAVLENGGGMAQWKLLLQQPAARPQVLAAMDNLLTSWSETVETNLVHNNADAANEAIAAAKHRTAAATQFAELTDEPQYDAKFATHRASAAAQGLVARRFIKDDLKLADDVAALLAKADQLSPRDAARLQLLSRSGKLSQPSPELLNIEFLKRLATLRAPLRDAWETDLYDEVVALTIDQAEKSAGDLGEEAKTLFGKLPASGTLKLVLAHQALVRAVGDPDQRDTHLQEAAQRLDEVTGNEKAVASLRQWLAFLQATGTVEQLTATVAAYDDWTATAANTARADAWFGDFADAVVRRARDWNLKQVSQAIDALDARPDGPPKGEITAQSRQIVARLRERRLQLVATAEGFSSADYKLFDTDAREIIKLRQPTDRLPHILHASVVDALLVEAALGTKISEPLKFDDSTKEAAQRMAETPAEQVDAKNFPQQWDYVLFVRGLTETFASPLPRTLSWDSQSKSSWLQPLFRRSLAAYRCHFLSGKFPALPSSHQYEGALAQYAGRSWLEESFRWAAYPVVAAKLALCGLYDRNDEDWKLIAGYATQALDAKDLKTQLAAEQAELFAHLLLARAAAGSHLKEPASAGVAAYARVLDEVCDVNRGRRKPLEDRAIYLRVILPARALAQQRVPDPPELVRAASFQEAERKDLAAIFGSQGALLERDNYHAIALADEHYGGAKLKYDEKLNRSYDEMRQGFAKAAALEPPGERRLRWLVGLSFALDQAFELRTMIDPKLDLVAEINKLCQDLQAVVTQIEQADKQHFSIPMLQGLIGLYKIRAAGTFSDSPDEYTAAIKLFDDARVRLDARPDIETPWCQSWKAAILECSSIASLEKSWLLPWGEEKQKELLAAVRFGRSATKVNPEYRANPTRAYFAFGHALEDTALHLNFPVFYDRSQAVFDEADELPGLGPFHANRTQEALLRLKFRRVRSDPDFPDDARAAGRRSLPDDFRAVIASMKELKYFAAARDASFWLGQVHFDLYQDAANYRSAEDIYTELAATSDNANKARFLIIAIEAAQAQKTTESLKRAAGYLQQLAPVEDHIRRADEWVIVARMRATAVTEADANANKSGDAYKEKNFENFRQQIPLLDARAKKLSPQQAALLPILARQAVGGADCAPTQLMDRGSILLQSQSLCRDAPASAMGEAERAERLIENYSLLGATWIKRAAGGATLMDKRASAREALTNMMDGLKRAYQHESTVGQLQCLDEDGKPVPDVKPAFGYIAAIKRLGDLDMIFRTKLIDAGSPTPAELRQLDTWLNDASRRLDAKSYKTPFERATKANIDNNYLRVIETKLAS